MSDHKQDEDGWELHHPSDTSKKKLTVSRETVRLLRSVGEMMRPNDSGGTGGWCPKCCSTYVSSC